MIKEIEIETALNLERVQFADLRSPGEFREAHIPGAVNIPFLDDAEHLEVGAIYRQEGIDQARNRGLELVGPRLASMVDNIRKATQHGQLVIYCWRGGERSRAVARALELMGVNGFRLTGGYKAYRGYVRQLLEGLPRGQVVVIHGLTGTGKTAIIKSLRKRGLPGLDLEGIANHRGSVFGSIGLGEQPAQKQFESLMAQELESLSAYKYVIVESESRRIGRLFLPDQLYNMMQSGHHVLVYDTLENRVNRLVAEYVENIPQNNLEILSALQGLERYLGKKRIHAICELIENHHYHEATEILLTKYYDPLYGYANHPDQRFDISIDGQDSEKAAAVLADLLQDLVKGGSQVGKSR